ncbi:hypothetical protein GCM10007094_23080 [Pseudovibrio japonicus]|uniref:Uncharacterized protein n=2 Tax=Pseudovibrio japonicus TaxID=366534 RepID=A0ABQ3ECG7_9HYPH|nr:hypothetical protein GCM10007094_23080 [Pseudovibrio japonicus]
MERGDLYQMMGLINLDADCHDQFKTPYPEVGEIRGDQIDRWLAANSDVTNWIILDDESDFHDHQKPRLIQTSMEDGILLSHFTQAENVIERIFQPCDNPNPQET